MIWSGQTQSNGAPTTFYSYNWNVWNRTATSVHVELSVYVRMMWYNSYFSYAIGHETWVNGVYQYADIKTGRQFWGQYADWGIYGSDAADRDGSMWHGPFLVFSADVPMGVDDSHVSVVPKIIRPYTGSGEEQEITGWQGDPCDGYWWDSGDHEDGAFLNNRWNEELDGCDIGVYPRPSDVPAFPLLPVRVDVANQETAIHTGDWADSQRAAGYRVRMSFGSPGTNPTQSWTVQESSASVKVSNVALGERVDGQRVYMGIRPYDSAGVESRNETWSDASTYFEIPSEAPSAASLMGRRGIADWILYRGEKAYLSYSGQKDGSYPINRFRLVRGDGVSVDWNPQDASGALQKTVQLAIPSVDKPNQHIPFVLRAYNTKDRPVYLKGTTSWLSFDVYWYGGLCWIQTDAGWEEGLTYVYDGTVWREAVQVFIWNGSSWKTL